MTTYAQFKAQIEGELGASDLSDAVSLAVHDAIAHYEAEHNYHAEARAWALLDPTATDPRWYDMPDDFVELDRLVITDNNDRTYRINIRTNEWMDDHYDRVSTYTSLPVDASVYGQQLRLEPPCDATYTIEMAYRYTISPPMSASDSVVWTNELGNLIRFRAKWDVYLNTMHDAEMAQLQKGAEMEAFTMAERRRLRQKRKAKITPHY